MRLVQEYASDAFHPSLSGEESQRELVHSGKRDSHHEKLGYGGERQRESVHVVASLSKGYYRWYQDGKEGLPIGWGRMSYDRVLRRQPSQDLRELSLFECAQ